MENQIAISELTSGLVSLIDAILAATKHEPATSAGKQNLNIVEALHAVRDRFQQMRLACDEGRCSVTEFVAGMNGIMQDLRSRTIEPLSDDKSPVSC